MAKAIFIEKQGGIEEFKIKPVNLQKLKTGQLLIRQTAIGINFIDINQRRGQYNLPELPAILGYEACGIVEEVSPELSDHFKPGHKVAYATAPMGAYCNFRILDHKYVVQVPQDLSDEIVAASFLKMLTAHYLLRRTFYIIPGKVALIHAAAGGVGSILCQWAKELGAIVIGTVGSDEKIEIAKSFGCDLVFNYNKEKYADRILDLTEGNGVNVVYDSVGNATFDESINSLCKLGMMVCFGESSGPVPPFDLRILSRRSLFLTRPTIFDYKANRMELVLSADDVFAMLMQNRIHITYNRYKFENVGEAHKMIEDRKTIGSNILVV